MKEHWKDILGFEAHEITGINHGNIGSCCCGNRKNAEVTFGNTRNIRGIKRNV